MACAPPCSRSGWTVADHLVGGLHCADASDAAAAFVLGVLEPAEAAAVRAHLAGCPEAHAEFAELGSVVPALLETVELVEPPAGLRGRILAAAASDTQVASTPAAAREPTAPKRAIDIPPLSDTQRGSWSPSLFRRPVWAAVAMAAAIAALALGAWNLQLRSEIDGLSGYRNGVATVLEAAAEPGAQLAALNDPKNPSGPAGLAAVATDGTVTLVMGDLAATSGAQVYEAWLIAGTGNPIPIGGFNVGADGAAVLTSQHAPLGAGVTIALTLEPGPGATTPTLPIIAAGKAAGQSS
jgi:anti-sigma-K factor RskA